jgi:NAD(P)-dependent dehydrogenase (short-subunit alcohol dehydrogenase family)
MVFEHKVALVTGGSSGIGQATAVGFAAQGARVFIADIDVAAGKKVAQGINESGGQATFVKTDVSNASEVEAFVNRVIETCGRLDYAFNNAGIEDALMPTADCTEENWDRIIKINLKGVWLCMKYEIPQMIKQRAGVIVNTASTAGLVGAPGWPAYSASKGGIIQLTRTAALEYAKFGIRINAVCPGAVRTPLSYRIRAHVAKLKVPDVEPPPMGRRAEPEEITRVVLWLCSDEASFVTGIAMPVDGGVTAQ